MHVALFVTMAVFVAGQGIYYLRQAERIASRREPPAFFASATRVRGLGTLFLVLAVAYAVIAATGL